MTEYWKSNANYWCDLCKVWMTDKQSTRAVHEAGIKHTELVQKKLRAMRVNAVAEKNEKKLVESSMSKIEFAAKRQFAKDKAAEEAHIAATLGSWALDSGTGYLYNALHRYYFDIKTGMYYGGDPVAWTTEPKMPKDARYKSAALVPGGESCAGGGSVEDRNGRGASTSGRRVNIARVDASSHPLGSLGGYSMPSIGTIGGARGVGGAASTAAAANTAGAVKRKREELMRKLPPQKMTQEEVEANAKREAAKQRVQKRTMQNFGLA